MKTIPIDYIRAFKASPDLCIDGMHIPDKDPRSPYSEVQFPIRRKLLLETGSITAIDLCCQYINEHGIPRTWGSYGFKHEIERIFNHYITNGQVMLAAVICGYTLVRIRNTQNCTFRLGNGKKPQGERHE